MDLCDEHLRYMPKEVVVNISRHLFQADINRLAQTCRQFYEELRLELYRRNARESRSSALLWAAFHDNCKMAKLCLLAGASHGIVRVEVSDPLLPGDDVLRYYDSWNKGRMRHQHYEITPLWIAAAYGNQAVARVLIEGGADLDLCGPLSAAVCTGSEEVVKLLLSYRVDLEDELEWKGTALELAVHRQHETITRLLLEAGANPDPVHDGDIDLHDPDYEREALLFYAAGTAQNESTTRLLIEYGARVDLLNSGQRSILGIARENRWPGIIRLLLAKGADPEAQDDRYDRSERSPLVRAAYEGDTACCQALIEGGASIESTSQLDGVTALSLAAEEGHYDTVKLLVENGANLDNLDDLSLTPLTHAARRSHWDIVELLLESGAMVSFTGHRLRTVLHYAAKEGFSTFVDRLLKHGAPVNTVDADGATALHHAAWSGSTSSVRLLLKHGADIEAVTPAKQTPLMCACQSGRLETVRELLQLGASTENKAGAYLSPLEAATVGHEVEIVRELLARGSSLDKDRECRALIEACAHNDLQIAALLLEAGANANVNNVPGDMSLTPLWTAVGQGNGDMVRLLLDWGAEVTGPQSKLGGFGDFRDHDAGSQELLSFARKMDPMGIYIQLENALNAILFEGTSDDEFAPEIDDSMQMD